MDKKNFLIDYDSDEDILSISKVNEKVKFSFDIRFPNGDLVVNYGFDGKIVGIEFFNAISNYFPRLKEADMSKASASLSIEYGANWGKINYLIFVPNIDGCNCPIQGFIPTPYNKKMVMQH